MLLIADLKNLSDIDVTRERESQVAFEIVRIYTNADKCQHEPPTRGNLFIK